nr:Acetyltransferase (GNAT) family [uncultured bacterium]
MPNTIHSAHDITDQEWDALRTLYVEAFVAMSSTLSACDLALMDNHPEQFWAGVFDRDKPQSTAKNYTFSLTKEGERIIAYGLYTYVNGTQYLYIHHFVVHPDYQGQGLGKRLMCAIEELHSEAKKVGLLTRTYNVLAQNFYERLGFSATSDVPALIREYYSNDRVYMERSK